MDTFWTFIQSVLERTFRCWVIVMPDERGVRTFCGKHPRELMPGLHMFWPLFGWVETVSVVEQVVDARTQSITSSDGCSVAVGISIAYEVVDTVKAFYHVNDFGLSLQNESLRIVEEYVSNHTFDECFNSVTMREAILTGMRTAAAERWGIDIHRIGRTEFVKHRAIRLMQDSE